MTNLSSATSNNESVVQLVIIQPSSFCNLDCQYCYVPDRLDKRVIDLSLLEEILRKVFCSSIVADDFRLLWHAGEPLALGIKFYEDVFNTMNRLNVLNKSFTHSFQTNATLVNANWADFFLSNQVSLGVSIDGPRHLHDSNRVTWAGKGTFDSTMRGVRFLRDAGIPLSALCVVTDETLDYGTELIQFFLDEGFTYLGLNIENPSGINPSTSFAEKGTSASELELEERFKTFIGDVFDAWLPNKHKLQIREFNNMFSIFQLVKSDSSAEILTDASSPCRILTFSREGNFTTFSPEMLSGTPNDPNQFVIGNIQDINSIEDMLNLEKLHNLYGEISKGIKKCKDECSYYSVCGGGVPSSKFYEHGAFNTSQTQDCRFNTQLVADLLLSRLSSLT